MSRNSPTPGETGLQRRFNLKAFLAARHMKPESYGTMDVSMEWPLPLNIQRLDVEANTALDFVAPALGSGTHMLLVRAYFINTAGISAAEHLTLQMIPPGGTTIQTLYNTSLYDDEIPIVSTVTNRVGAAVPPMPALRPVYCPEGFKLRLTGSGVPATTVGRLEFTTLTYPSTQPLTSLFNCT